MKNTPALTNFTLQEFEEEIAKSEIERFRARQILRWLYRHNATSFHEMTDISEELQQDLERRYKTFSTKVKARYKSTDDTEKFLIELVDGNIIETVLISDNSRKTVCISTQVGCPIRCKFCASGLNGFVRNLETCEIVEQVLHIKHTLPLNARINNLVIMGIGEPLLNFDNLIKSLKIFKASWGMGIGYNKITLSTVGVLLDKIKKMQLKNITPNLALSLHAPNDKIRKELTPMIKSKIREIIKIGSEYKKTTGKNVTFEYVLLNSINDCKKHALELGKKLRDTRCKVNIIPYNKVDGLSYNEPPKEALDKFVTTLGRCGVPVTVRKRKGDDISAACGQLRIRHNE